MKRIVLSVLVLSLGVGLHAQTMPERNTDKPARIERKKGHHGHGTDFKELNLTEDQKAKFKEQNESFRKQLEDLRKQDNITVKESREKMATLRKEHKAKLDGILTSDQKAKLEKMKTERKTKMEAGNKERAARMKEKLGLTDEQSAKLDKNRQEMGEKMKAIRENNSLDEAQKKEQMKQLMKEQKESMKTILTEEQLKKLQESKKRGHDRKDGARPAKEKQSI